MSGEINVTTDIDGVDVKNMNDMAIFNKIAAQKADLKNLNSMDISGAAMDKAKAEIEAKIAGLTALVNDRQEDDSAE